MHALADDRNISPAGLQIREPGLVEYEPTWHAMREFSSMRDAQSADEIWYLQHPPVYTLGLNGKPEHILDAGTIPVVNVDRGGQVTYHGPGQLVVYLLLDLQRRNLGVKQFVALIEQVLIDTLAEYAIAGERKAGAPGIYVANSKIAALGLRIRRGCSYHGLALNINMDLAPFTRINPCGHADMRVTQIADLCPDKPSLADVQTRLHRHLLRQLGYNKR